ncbi:cytochrome c oxidase assembly factor 8 isoform X2 [Sphaeramia orbicularis]|uniref:cytochrome c oxidase assembly factor 8 isoform X2 n=1 Tax=Sphaeramia orbicularis TaxID=375764 RepID=UPI00117BF82C|nr:apoptogenic protein 1, mitochondrial isoform X2 [Sphaeramia orbicularis]
MSLKAAAGCVTRRIRAPVLGHGLSAAENRWCSSKQATTHQDKPPKTSNFRPAASSTHDWIGPPNPLSNLRPIIYHIPENETELEKRLRHLRQDTEDWNHDFWTKQNVTFSKEKDAFIFSQLKAKGLSVRDEQGNGTDVTSPSLCSWPESLCIRCGGQLRINTAARKPALLPPDNQ